MSDNFLNSLGDINLAPKNYGIWSFTPDFNVPDDTRVGDPANILPFNIPVEGQLPGMVNGVFTAPQKALYLAQWFGLRVGLDGVAGSFRVIEIIKNNDRTLGGTEKHYPLIVNSDRRFSVFCTVELDVSDTLIAGLDQDTGAVFPIASATCRMTIIKLFDRR